MDLMLAAMQSPGARNLLWVLLVVWCAAQVAAAVSAVWGVIAARKGRLRWGRAALFVQLVSLLAPTLTLLMHLGVFMVLGGLSFDLNDGAFEGWEWFRRLHVSLVGPLFFANPASMVTAIVALVAWSARGARQLNAGLMAAVISSLIASIFVVFNMLRT